MKYSSFVALIVLFAVMAHARRLQFVTASGSEPAMITSMEKTSPSVQAFGYSIGGVDANLFGAKMDFSIDAMLGYTARVFSLSLMKTDYLIFNPIFSTQAKAVIYFELSLFIIQLRTTFDFTGYKFNFFDFFFQYNIDSYQKYCYGAQWETQALQASVNTEVNVNECTFGLIGAFYNSGAQFKDCVWTRYKPTQPAWTMAFLEDQVLAGDGEPYGELVEVKCNFSYY